MEAIYARQSLDKKDSLSIETQIELCKLESTGDVKVYIDRGFSGKNTNRPQFTKMMEDIEKGLVDKVIVYKLDRLSRSLLDFAAMIDTFKRHDVAFLSTREKFDTATPIGNAMLSILMVFAQLERETIQLRVQDSYHARSQRGAYDAAAPYGYQKAKAMVQGKHISTLEIEPESSAIVQAAFHAYAFTDESLGSLAKGLNHRGIPSPNGTEWDSGKLSRIMANPLYVKADADIYRFYESAGMKITNPIDDFLGERGCVTYGAWDRSRRKFSQWDKLTLSLGLHSGMIEPAVFLRCQQKLMHNVQLGNEGKGKHTWLTGLMKCGYCGHAMRVVASGRCIPRVSCSGKTNYGTCEEYEKRWLVADLEAVVEAELFRAVRQKQTLKAKIQQEEDALEKRRKVQIAKVEQQIQNLLDGLAEAKGITVQYLNERINALEGERRSLLQEQQQAKAANMGEENMRQLGDVLTLWEQMNLEQKRETAKLLIERIQIYNDKVKILWKYNFMEQA